jgi:hypothetical protein
VIPVTPSGPPARFAIFHYSFPGRVAIRGSPIQSRQEGGTVHNTFRAFMLSELDRKCGRQLSP